MKKLLMFSIMALFFAFIFHENRNVEAATITCSGNMSVVCAKGTMGDATVIMYGDNKIIRPN
jgi:hypothetical protein